MDPIPYNGMAKHQQHGVTTHPSSAKHFVFVLVVKSTAWSVWCWLAVLPPVPCWFHHPAGRLLVMLMGGCVLMHTHHQPPNTLVPHNTHAPWACSHTHHPQVPPPLVCCPVVVVQQWQQLRLVCCAWARGKVWLVINHQTPHSHHNNHAAHLVWLW